MTQTTALSMSEDEIKRRHREGTSVEILAELNACAPIEAKPKPTLPPLPAIEPDPVDHPPHYNQGEIECIDAIRAALGADGFLKYCTGNVLKYVWRWQRKNGAEDLRKAIWYLDRMLMVLNDADD